MVNSDSERDSVTSHMLPVDQSARVTRCGLIQSIGLGGAAAALAAGALRTSNHLILASNQIDSTPPAPTAPAPSIDPIVDLAAKLNYDAEAIFAFNQASYVTGVNLMVDGVISGPLN